MADVAAVRQLKSLDGARKEERKEGREEGRKSGRKEGKKRKKYCFGAHGHDIVREMERK